MNHMKNNKIIVCFFTSLYSFWSFCYAQKVSESIDLTYAFIGAGPIEVLKNEVLKKHSIGINECEILVLFFDHDPNMFKSLIIKREYLEKDVNPFSGTVMTPDYKVITLSEESDVAMVTSIDEKEKNSLKSQLIPFLVQSKIGVQSINARKMKGLHDEKNCYIFLCQERKLIGGFIFNPQEGTRSESVYSILWECFKKYEKVK